MSSIKPLTLWGHWGGPNPWKVRMLLQELDLPHDYRIVEMPEAKSEEYIKLNPNGRLPTLQDPNTGITLWETAAIIQYVADTYDKEGKLSYASGPEKYLAQQWLAFQVSGQGPYIGQATWFLRFHSEKIQSAIDRYVDETFRIISVIDLGLERTGSGWLVGDKMTYADLSFVTWAVIGEGVLKQVGKLDGLQEKYPRYAAWLARMCDRPVVKKALGEIAEGRKAHGLP